MLRMRSQFLNCIVILIVGIIMCQYEFIFKWCGGALVIISIGMLYTISQHYFSDIIPVIKKILFQKNIVDVLVCALILMLSVAMFQDVYSGEQLMSGDHSIHLTQIRFLIESVEKNGHVWGYTHSRFAGTPLNYSYPMGAYLFVSAIHVLFLGLIPLKVTYGIALSLMYALSGISIYFLGKKVFNRLAGFIAAYFMLFDSGGREAGGWYWSIITGVWSVNLSVSFMLLALCCFEDVLIGKKGDGRAIGLFGLFMGMAILCHPLALIFFGIIIPVGVLSHLIINNPRNKSKFFIPLLTTCCIGIAVGGLWTFPFLWANEFMSLKGHAGNSLNYIAKKIVEADSPILRPYTVVFGVLGCILLITSNRLYRFLIGICTFIFLIGSSSPYLQKMEIFEIFPILMKINYARMAMLYKPFLFLGAAVFVAWTIKMITQMIHEEWHQSNSGSDQNWQSILRRRFWKLLLIGLFILPIVNSTFLFNYKINVRRYNEKLTKHMDTFDERKKIIRRVNKMHGEDKQFFRLADVSKDGLDHRSLNMIPLLDVPFIRSRGETANFFRYKLRTFTINRKMFELTNVRFFISEELMKNDSFRLIRKFRRLYLYEFLDWKKDRYSIIDGKADVNIQKFTDKEIVLKVEPGAEGELMLHATYFPRWTAKLNDAPIKVYATTLKANIGYNAFMTVNLKNGAGIYRFTYQIGYIEKMSLCLFILGVMCSLFLIFPFRRKIAIS